MAGLLWALSSVFNLDDLHIIGPLLVPNKTSWLEETLVLHEHVMNSFIQLDDNEYACDVALPILTLEHNPTDWEAMCVSIACLGGICEALLVTRDKTRLSTVISLLRKAIGWHMDAANGEVAGLGERIKCSLAASVGRIYTRIGKEIGCSASLLEYGIETLLEFAFGIDDLPGSAPIVNRSPGSGEMASNMILTNSAWSIATMCNELVAKVDREHAALALAKITEFTQSFCSAFFTFMNRMKSSSSSSSSGWVYGESSGSTLRRIFLILIKLLTACFQKHNSEQSQISTSVPLNYSSLLMQTRDFIRGKCSSLDQANERTMSVLRTMESLGNLQFCRVNDPEHLQLVEGVLESLLDTCYSDILFVGLFPELDTIWVPLPGQGENVWTENAIVLSKALFFMRLTPAALGLPQHNNESVDDGRGKRLVFCVEQLVPYSFLLLHHKDEVVRKSAQQFFHVLLTCLPAHNAKDVAERLAPYYIDRCLEKLNLLQPDEFGICIRKLIGLLPVDGRSLKYCLDKIQGDVVDLFRRDQRDDALMLFDVCCKCMLWFPLAVLHACLQAVSEIIDFEGGQATIPILYKIVSTNKDYNRQVQLARFFLKVRHSIHDPKLDQRLTM